MSETHKASFPALSEAANSFLDEIREQLPDSAAVLWDNVLQCLSRPSNGTQALITCITELPEVDFLELLEQCIDNGDIDKDDFEALAEEYPSILTPDAAVTFIHLFEE